MPKQYQNDRAVWIVTDDVDEYDSSYLACRR